MKIDDLIKQLEQAQQSGIEEVLILSEEGETLLDIEDSSFIHTQKVMLDFIEMETGTPTILFTIG